MTPATVAFVYEGNAGRSPLAAALAERSEPDHPSAGDLATRVERLFDPFDP